MSRRSKAVAAAEVPIWRWRRWINRAQTELWQERVVCAGLSSWTLTERPDRVRAALDVYVESKSGATAVQRRWRGTVSRIQSGAWLPKGPASVTKIGKGLVIVHGSAEEIPLRKERSPALVIPHGLAFGSGEHSTTFMLLRAMISRPGGWERMRVLDLGTGSGVLALAARQLGAGTIVATDFDADAIRVARENELLNFPRRRIEWCRGDVLKLKVDSRYDLVLANLYSGVLCAAASKIMACVAPGGQLWMSGVLGTQLEEVSEAYRAAGLRLIRVVRRGKWIMLQGQRDQVMSLGVK